MFAVEFAANAAGNVMFTRCTFPRVSASRWNEAPAPFTLTLLTLAFELIRKVNADPTPRPTLLSVKVATALSARSDCWMFAAMSKAATCHDARASSWAVASSGSETIERQNMKMLKQIFFIIELRFEI